MRAGLKYHWLSMAYRRGLEANWDQDLFFPVDVDEYTFTIEVRKSPLRFAIRESPLNYDQFLISYDPPNYPSAASKMQWTSGSSLQAREVDDKLEDWLLHAVANYVSEHNPVD